jgi:integrase
MSVDEVICCYQEAVNKEDTQLSDLIMIGAYTGLRISEICHLEIDDIKLREGFLKVKDSKNESGIREVPINEEMKPPRPGPPVSPPLCAPQPLTSSLVIPAGTVYVCGMPV